MLSFMRKNANSWLMIIVFIIIVFVFAINFIPLVGETNKKLLFAAKVNKHIITMKEFNFFYLNKLHQIRQIRQNYGKNAEEKSILKILVLEKLINQEILSQLALENNIFISDKDIAKFIKNNYSTGKEPFNKESYLKILYYYKITKIEFEKILRKKLLSECMENLLITGTNVSNDELWQIFKKQNDKISLDFIKINPNFFIVKKKFSKKYINDFLNKNKNKIKYYYYDNIHKYKTSKEVKFEKILNINKKTDNLNKLINFTLKEVEQDIALILIKKQEQEKIAKKYAEQILKNDIIIKNFKLLKVNIDNKNKIFSPKIGFTNKFNENTYYIPQIGKSMRIAEIAFSLTEKFPIFKEVIKVEKNFFIIKLKNVEYVTKKIFNKESKKFSIAIRNKRKQKFVKEYLDYLRKTTEIEYNPIFKK